MTVVIWVASILILVFGFVVVRGAPYVPSHRRYVKKSFKELYEVSGNDVLVDLGSGDGVVLRAAAEQGARAVGYELNPLLVLVTRLLSWGNERVQVKPADFWLVGLPEETTIVYAFAVSRDMKKLQKKMQQWTDACGHQLLLMTYGAKLDKEPLRALDGHTLYLFEPESLQRIKP